MKRKLGRTGIEVSALGLGGWAIGGITKAPIASGSGMFGWGEVDDNESIKAIHAAVANGITFFETSDVYGTGHSESILGTALEGKRDKVVLATKFGYDFDSYTRQMLGPNTSPEYIRRACEGSLKRLRTDYIDLYMLHIGEYDPEYLDDICDVLDRLVANGKIRSYGWCTLPYRTEEASVFANRNNCAAIEHKLNILEDAPEMIGFCEDNNISSINLAPLGMSLLTGKITKETKFSEHDVRNGWDLKNGLQAKQLKKLEQLREILTFDGRSVVQGTLGWIWSRSNCTIPIPGFRTVKQVEENAAAMAFGPLSDAQMNQISEVLKG